MEQLDAYGDAAEADLRRKRVQKHLREKDFQGCAETRLFETDPFGCLKTAELQAVLDRTCRKIADLPAPAPESRIRTFSAVAPGQTGTMTVE